MLVKQIMNFRRVQKIKSIKKIVFWGTCCNLLYRTYLPSFLLFRLDTKERRPVVTDKLANVQLPVKVSLKRLKIVIFDSNSTSLSTKLNTDSVHCVLLLILQESSVAEPEPIFWVGPAPFFWQVKNEMIYRSSLFIVYCKYFCIIISTGTVPVGTCSIYLLYS